MPKFLAGQFGYWKGKKRPPFNQEWRNKISAKMKGKKNARKTNKEIRETYRKRHPEKVKEWYANNREKVKEYQLKRKFGITIEQFKVLKEVQGGKCAICEKYETYTSGVKRTQKDLSVDHNHETGKIRGLLCHRCNVIIGLGEENTMFLEKIINYLKNHAEVH